MKIKALAMQTKILVMLATCTVAGAGQAETDIETLEASLVTVTATIDGTRQESVGIALDAEQVLALAPEKLQRAEFSVSPWAGSATLVAAARTLGEDLPVVLLDVAGLEADPVTFSLHEPIPGQVVYSPFGEDSARELVKGALAEGFEFQPQEGLLFKKPKGPSLRLVSHNALITADHFGAPLYNECGEVIGISMPDSRLDKDERAADPRETMVALRAAQVLEWLQEAGVAVSTTDDQCLSAEERAELARQEAERAESQAQEAQSQAEEAQRRAEETERRLEDVEQEAASAREKVEEAEAELAQIQSRASATEEEKAAAQQALDEARSEVVAAQQETEALRTEIERLQQAAQEEQARLWDQIRLYGGITAAVVVLVLVLWWLSVRAKKKQMRAAHERAEEAEQKAEHAVAESEARVAPFECVLNGQDIAGKRHLLKLHRNALGDPRGVVLGRNPRNSTFIIAHEEIGREHVRLFVQDGTLYAEDLKSVNGTSVDGTRLNPNAPVPLADGATLQLGPITFKVQLG